MNIIYKIRNINNQIRKMSKETKYVSRDFDEFQNLDSKSFGVRSDPKNYNINVYTSAGMTKKQKDILEEEIDSKLKKRSYDVNKLKESEKRWNQRREIRIGQKDFGNLFEDRFASWEAEKTFYDFLDAISENADFYYTKDNSKEYIYEEWKKGSNIWDVINDLKNEEHSLKSSHGLTGTLLGWD